MQQWISNVEIIKTDGNEIIWVRFLWLSVQAPPMLWIRYVVCRGARGVQMKVVKKYQETRRLQNCENARCLRGQR